MRTIILLFYTVLLPICVFSNNIESENLIVQAKAFQKAKKFYKALNLLNKAESLVKIDSSYSEKDLFPIYHAFGDCYFDKEDYKKTFEYLQKAEKLLESKQTVDINKVANLWHSYGELYVAQKEHEKAGSYYLKYCTEVEGFYKNDKEVEALYFKNKKKAGTSYLRAGQVVLAKEIYLEVIPAFPKDKYLKTQYITRGNLGYCYDELGEYDKAIEQYEICESLNENLEVKYTSATNNLGSLYFVATGDYDKAEYYYKKVLNIIDKNPTAKKDNYCYAAKNLCTIYFERKDYDKAYKYINMALKSGLKIYGPEFHLTNEILSEKGRILMHKGKIKQAEALFDQANKNLSIDPNDKGTYENMPYTPQLHNVILHQSKAYMELYERTNDLSMLKKGNFLSDVTIAIINSARSSLSNSDSKAALMNAASAVFQLKVQILEYLYSETKNKQYVNDAFELFEKTNNFILLEAVLKNDVANRLGLPQEIFDQENNLKAKLAEAESSLYEKQVYTPNDSIGIKADEKLVANCKSEYRSFVADLKKNHSRYFNLNYSDEVVNIEQLQQKFLGEDQTLIHYYVSEEVIHCIAITKNEVGFYLLPNKEIIIENVKTLRDGIFQAHKMSNSSAGLASVNKASFDLYNALIKPIEIPLKKKLIFIPMEELAYIPFDVLIKTEPIKHAEFYDYKFLLRDHAISYAYSSTLLNDANSKKNIKETSANFVGFAPVFNSRKIASIRSELVSLAHNESEVNKINEIVGGDVFAELDASKEKFVALCGDYKILHLATHGVSNSDEGENSYLAFSENELVDENSLLYARDIYNLNLDADLVVLSACETAIGEVQLGEGVISLSRAFTYAGARSNITTLWQVNDEAASILMENFYKELKLGVPKDEALRNAKLTYIKNCSNEFAHPFYWSAFIPTGDMASIKIEEPKNYIQSGMLGLFGVSLLGIGGYLLKRRVA